MYGVPQTILLDKLADRWPKEILGQERNPFLQWRRSTHFDFANTLGNFGYPFTKNNFCNDVKYVEYLDGRVTPFKDKQLEKELLYAIRGRHPDMAFRKTMSHAVIRFVIRVTVKYGCFVTGVRPQVLHKVAEYNFYWKLLLA